MWNQRLSIKSNVIAWFKQHWIIENPILHHGRFRAVNLGSLSVSLSVSLPVSSLLHSFVCQFIRSFVLSFQKNGFLLVKYLIVVLSIDSFIHLDFFWDCLRYMNTFVSKEEWLPQTQLPRLRPRPQLQSGVYLTLNEKKCWKTPKMSIVNHVSGISQPPNPWFLAWAWIPLVLSQIGKPPMFHAQFH